MAADATLVEDLQAQLPIQLQPYPASGATSGLVIVDEIHGFCTVGAGNLAPSEPDAADRAHGRRRPTGSPGASPRRSAPILAFLDTHEPGKPEPPYPPHCERGTGEEDLVPETRLARGLRLRDLAAQGLHQRLRRRHRGELHRRRHGQHHNKVVDWVNSHRLDAVVAVGICTDICVMDFVLTLLSARNHGLMPTLEDIVVYEPATATYDLPLDSGRGARPAADRGASARPRPTTWGSTSWPRAARCWPPS